MVKIMKIMMIIMKGRQRIVEDTDENDVGEK